MWIVGPLKALDVRVGLEWAAVLRGCSGYAVIVDHFGCSLVTGQVTVEVVESTDVLLAKIYVRIMSVPGVHDQNVPNEVPDHTWLILNLLFLERNALVVEEFPGLDGCFAGELAFITLAPEGDFTVRDIIDEEIVNDLPFFVLDGFAQIQLKFVRWSFYGALIVSGSRRYQA